MFYEWGIKLKVYIDTREQEVINRIINFYNSNKEDYPNIDSIEVVELDTGDFCTLDNQFGCERKSNKDFVSSIKSGHIKQQLYELRQKYHQPMLIVEGYDGMIDCISKNPQLHPNVILGTVTSAWSHNGVHIQFVGGFYVQFILDTVNKLYDNKRQQYESIGYTPIRRTINKKDFLKYFILGLPGIKWKIGSKLLDNFNSVESLVNCNIESLMKIEGIGKEKALKIKEIFK